MHPSHMSLPLLPFCLFHQSQDLVPRSSHSLSWPPFWINLHPPWTNQSAILKIVEEKALGTRLTNPPCQSFNLAWIFFTSSLKENSIQDFSSPRVVATVAGSWTSCLGLKHWSCCFPFKEMTLSCISSCVLQLDDWLKHFLQCLHSYGFSPVWVRSCSLRFDA